MAIKDILVHIDSTQRGESSLKIAISVAKRSDAHLIVLFVVSRPAILEHLRGQAVQRMSEEMYANGVRIADIYKAEMEREGISSEWRMVDQPGLSLNEVTEHVVLNSRCVDLVVLGQHNPHRADAGLPADLADRVVLGGGAPVLVIPYVGEYVLDEIRAMIAWDGGRESARAVRGALPLLVSAQKAVVVAVNPYKGNPATQAKASADEVRLHLARHNIDATAQHVVNDELGIGDSLLSRAADEGINLMISGAYHNSRTREKLLGGVTRQLLEQMTLPVLMSN